MSEYFRVLKRLQSEQLQPKPLERGIGAPARSRPVQRPVVKPLLEHLPVEAVSPLAREVAPSPFSNLFENIRTLGEGNPTRALVFASVSAEPIRPVSSGLATHVRRLGLRPILAEIAAVGGRRFLRTVVDAADGAAEPLEDWPVDLADHASAAGVNDWLRSTESSADLVLIEGRPLADSIDSALLARACDGLVVVVRSEVTLRDALVVAIDRARAVGCHILGIVVHGSTDPLPDPIRCWIGTGKSILHRS